MLKIETKFLWIEQQVRKSLLSLRPFKDDAMHKRNGVFVASNSNEEHKGILYRTVNLATLCTAMHQIVLLKYYFLVV